MATKSRRRTTRGRNRKRKKQATPEVWNSEVLLLIILGISLLMCISNFGVGGSVGNWISSILFGCFGTLAYVFPVFLFLGTAFKISNRYDKVATIKLVAAIVFFLLLCFFLQLVVVGYKDSFTLAEGYHYGVEKKSGGGWFGGLFVGITCPSFGLVGAYVVDIVLLIICLVLITERSFLRGITRGSKKVYSTAREDALRRRENSERKRKEAEEKRESRAEQELRRNKKVSGVGKDTKIREENIQKSDNLTEIILPESIEPFDQYVEEPQVEVDLKSVFKVQPQIQPEPQIQSEPKIQPHSELSMPESMMEVELPFEEEIVIQKPQSTRVEKKPEVEQNVVMPKKEQAGSAKNKYELPPITLLKKATLKASGDSEKHLRDTANKLQQTLQNFGVKVTITNVSCGPSVTRYELQPEQGVKVSKIVGLTDDIKLNLAAADIRIEAPIPGKAAVGIEVPNKENVTVMFRDLIESDDFKRHPSNIAFAAGKDIGGKVIVTDIMKMPHLLIAGATGSGKSVCINTIIMSILYKADPEDVKLIMIDPKVVELSVYNGIPHLFIPVVTDPKKAAGALHWAVAEMTERYQKFAQYNVRDLKGYNQKVEGIKDIDEEDKPEKLPQIVIIVDELADLMMVAPGEVEDAICRLAQLARAAGIHLIIATQRPSVNVITGLIKANMPSRIAFSVSSGIDSRTILDMNGAEKLLGKGDMLFYPQGYQKPLRVQGAFVSDKEVADVVDFFNNQNVEVAYNKDIEEKMNQIPSQNGAGNSATTGDERDAIFMEAGKFIIDKDKASIGMLQRYFKIGFNRAARIMDQLADAGVVGPEEGTKPRKVLMSMEEFEGYVEEYV